MRNLYCWSVIWSNTQSTEYYYNASLSKVYNQISDYISSSKFHACNPLQCTKRTPLVWLVIFCANCLFVLIIWIYRVIYPSVVIVAQLYSFRADFIWTIVVKHISTCTYFLAKIFHMYYSYMIITFLHNSTHRITP